MRPGLLSHPGILHLVAGPSKWIPPFANINTNPQVGGANYQGLEVKFERRFNEGFSFLSGYTWSKTLVKQLGHRTSFFHLAPEKTTSRQHLPQRLFFAAVWDLPFGSGRKYGSQGALSHIIGGWQVSPIFEAQRGLPISPGVAGNPANTTGGQRPNRIGDGNLPRDQRTPERWFDISAFTVPDRFTFGNSAAWIIEGPGLINLDMMISRTFRFNERLSLDFRTEFFNLFNEAHFNFPNTTVNRAAGGRISSTQECCKMRQIQFGMKLIF